MNQMIALDRRDFLVSTAVFAGGMALTLSPAGAATKTAQKNMPWAPEKEASAEMSSWLAIAPDDTVMVRVPTPEIGNGAMTQVAMNVTEELGCDWAKVKVEFASVRRDYLEKGTYSVGMLPMFSGHGTDHLRMQHALQLGASARERLKAAAAARWKVPVAEIEAKNSLLTHKPSGRTLRYGQVAAEAAAIKLAAEPALKPQSEWTFLGRASPGKLHLPEIVTGSAVYGIDVQLPGMVHDALRQSPVHGGKLKSYDAKAVMGMPGVRAVVVVDPSKTKGSPVKAKPSMGMDATHSQSAVAVIADHYWQAKMALDALPVEWEAGAGADWKSSEQIYAAANAVLDKDAGKVLRKSGDVTAVTGPTTIEATYLTPYCDNAVMEPLNGTALVTADKVEVWHPTQDQQQAYWVAIDETGMAPDKVFFHQTYVGGGFGRRTMADDVRMVVAVAKEYPGVPVKLIWSREEVTRQGRYRTPIASRFKAVLDADGMPQAYKAHACFGGLALVFGFYDVPYVTSGAIPNVHISQSAAAFHVLTGAYRGPCYNSHAYMVETFIDECAAAAKIDPLEYRLRLLEKWDESWNTCLKVAGQKAGWGKPLPKGEGRGIAIANWPMAGVRKGGSTVCTVAHVAVSPEGVLSVKQVDISFDCGRVANRDAVAAQLEGGIIFGLNAVLNEEVTIRDGAVAEGNFDEYPILRIGEIPPRINVHFDALSGHDRFGMIGEAPVGPIQAAVGNAIFQATGKRLRTTPFRKHDLSWS